MNEKIENKDSHRQKVVNCQITQPQKKSILSMGLEFGPAQKKKRQAEARSDLDNFHRKLRTKDFFSIDLNQERRMLKINIRLNKPL